MDQNSLLSASRSIMVSGATLALAAAGLLLIIQQKRLALRAVWLGVFLAVAASCIGGA